MNNDTGRVEGLNASDVLSATEKGLDPASAGIMVQLPTRATSKRQPVNQSRRYLENGMLAKTETTYDQYNNPIEVREYDFDQLLERRTTTSYLSGPTR